jgi:hypothetical protein
VSWCGEVIRSSVKNECGNILGIRNDKQIESILTMMQSIFQVVISRCGSGRQGAMIGCVLIGKQGSLEPTHGVLASQDWEWSNR